MMNSTMTPTTTSSTVPAVRRMLVTVRTRSTRSSMLMTLRTHRLAAQRLADVAHRRRVLQLDLEAGVQRVAVEVLGQVLAALRLHRGSRKRTSASSRVT